MRMSCGHFAWWKDIMRSWWQHGDGYMSKPRLTDSDILAQLPAARRRAAGGEPRAERVRYDRVARRFEVTLTNGVVLTVPAELIASLRHAAERDLGAVQVGVAGLSLRWEPLDVDLSIAGLAAVAMGRRLLLRASGAAGGSARTAAKARAARENGKKGGRPRRSAAKGKG
jgi:hypothetical protein